MKRLNFSITCRMDKVIGLAIGIGKRELCFLFLCFLIEIKLDKNKL